MNRKVIICISRQYGSAGHNVGERLAEALGIPYYDKNLLTKTALEHNVSEADIEAVDEKPVSLASLGFPMGLRNPYSAHKAGYDDAIYYVMNDRVFYMQSETIKHIAAEGSCVIVGRAAEEVLKDDPAMLSVFIHGKLEDRVQRTMEREGLDHNQAEMTVRKMDKKRASYHNYYTDRKWGEAGSYHLAISTSRFGVEGAVAAIQRMVEAL